MRILVIGGTGGTGLEVISQAIERNIDVTAMVRNPDKLGRIADRITVATGNVFDPDSIAEHAAGTQGVLCTIGAPAGFLSRGTTTVYSRTATALSTALPVAAISRLIFCTSAGVESHDPGEILPYRLIAKPLFFQRAYDDMTVAERTIRASTLEWTLVRPGRLTDKPETGRYRVSPRFRSKGGISIARADVASFMLDQLTDRRWVHATPTLTN